MPYNDINTLVETNRSSEVCRLYGDIQFPNWNCSLM